MGTISRFKIFKKKILNAFKDNNKLKYYDWEINENLILLESKKGEDLAGNIFYLIKELSKEQYSKYKIILSIKKQLFGDISNIFSIYNIDNVELVETNSKEYYRYLYVSKYLFNDTTFPLDFIKKDTQIYINTWHGTPLKTLGKDAPKRGHGIVNVQRNFIMADYLVYPNEFMKNHIMDSFMIEKLTNAKIIYCGYFRNSIFFDKEKRDTIKNEKSFKNMQIIAYMPTWRGILSNIDSMKQLNKIENYLQELDNKLKDNQIFHVKLHNFIKEKIDFKKYKRIKPFPKEFETYEFLNIVDCLVTDYSSVFFDYAVTKKKIILFPYDEEEYLSTRGLYLSLDELPFPKVYSIDDLIKEINTPKMYKDDVFVNRFCSYDSINTPKFLCEYIFFNKNHSELIKIENIPKKEENVFIYTSSLVNNDIISSFISNLELISNKTKFNYFIVIKKKNARKKLEELSDLSKKYNYLIIDGKPNFKLEEIIAFHLFNHGICNKYFKKYLDNFYTRNLRKYFPSNKIDLIVQFSKYEPAITSLIAMFRNKKYIYINEDILKKLESNKCGLLNGIYNNYDKILIDDQLLKEYLSKKEKTNFNSKIELISHENRL